MPLHRVAHAHPPSRRSGSGRLVPACMPSLPPCCHPAVVLLSLALPFLASSRSNSPLQTQGTVLDVAAAHTHSVDALRANARVGGLASHLKLALLCTTQREGKRTCQWGAFSKMGHTGHGLDIGLPCAGADHHPLAPPCLPDPGCPLQARLRTGFCCRDIGASVAVMWRAARHAGPLLAVPSACIFLPASLPRLCRRSPAYALR
jgi:hypothetical protein